MADDMGYADAGFTGSQDIKTQNLDEIAASGMVFKQGYVTHPYCGPSRAGLLSGRYQHRFGFETNPAYDPANSVMGIDPDEKLFPERLKEAGYVTGCIGSGTSEQPRSSIQSIVGSIIFMAFLAVDMIIFASIWQRP